MQPRRDGPAGPATQDSRGPQARPDRFERPDRGDRPERFGGPRFGGRGRDFRSRRKTGTCAKHQRRLTVALKNARHMALLPYTAAQIRGS